MECIQGGRYYDNINYTSYPDEPQPSGFVRFVNVKSGAHSPSFAYGYGLASALVMGDRMFVHATATPFGIGSNNTVVSVFWSDDLVTWRSNPALGVNQPGVFPEGVTSKTLYNTCVRPVVAAGSGSLSSSYTFVMAYEFNEPGAGWQTGIALTSDPALETAQWVAAPRPANASWGTMAHANPTLRFAEVDGDGAPAEGRCTCPRRSLGKRRSGANRALILLESSDGALMTPSACAAREGAGREDFANRVADRLGRLPRVGPLG